MRSIDTIVDMKAASRTARSKEQKIAFVPTMGALHEAHIALVRRAKGLGDLVVMSVFVNPTQFGAGEDFDRYPRDLSRDAGLAAEAGVDILFAPGADAIYPHGFSSYVTVEGISERYEGVVRPGHFRGVATVVLKLFQIVNPDVAVFGQKDAQQVAVIRRLAEDFNLDVEIVVAPTVRDKDGVAFSSRNAYLSGAERQAARVIPAALKKAEGRVAEGELDARAVAGLLREEIGRQPMAALDYADVVSIEEFVPVERIGPEAIAIVATRFGTTRLIDNTVLKPPANESR